jgi:hypothetical protein
MVQTMEVVRVKVNGEIEKKLNVVSKIYEGTI